MMRKIIYATMQTVEPLMKEMERKEQEEMEGDIGKNE